MLINVIGAAVTLVLGIAVSLINFLLSKYIIKKYPDKYSMSTVLRSLLQVLFLVLVYFVGIHTPANVMYLLIGAVLGLSVSLFFFTYKLIKINQDTVKKNSSESQDLNKEEENDG